MRSLFSACSMAPLALAVLCCSTSLSATAADAPAATLTLSQAVRLALTHNPELAVARLELQAMEAVQLQAGARPNPELGVLIEDTRSATRSTTVQWSQAIELGGKRTARLAVAGQAREQAALALSAKQAELRAAVTSAFFELLLAQEQQRLSQASLALAAQASGIAARRLQAGKAAPLEHSRALVAEAGVRAELAQAQSDLRLARQRLISSWGAGKFSFEHAQGDVDALPASLEDSPAELLTAQPQAPAIRLAQMDIARRQAISAGERAKSVPDLTLTLGAKRDAQMGGTQAVLGFSIALPLLDRNQGNLLEALRREEQARELLNVATLKLQNDVGQAAERLRLTRQQVQTLRAEVLPVAQTAYDAALKGYELGKFALLDVLDAQRSLFQLKQQTLRHLADAWRASAELDRLLGQAQE